MCCVLLLCGCSSKREVKNYYDVVDTFDEFGFKEEKVSLHLNGGTYYFELNGESFDMFFQYDSCCFFYDALVHISAAACVLYQV